MYRKYYSIAFWSLIVILLAGVLALYRTGRLASNKPVFTPPPESVDLDWVSRRIDRMRFACCEDLDLDWLYHYVLRVDHPVEARAFAVAYIAEAYPHVSRDWQIRLREAVNYVATSTPPHMRANEAVSAARIVQRELPH